jgi:hypothetical protein
MTADKAAGPANQNMRTTDQHQLYFPRLLIDEALSQLFANKQPARPMYRNPFVRRNESRDGSIARMHRLTILYERA